MSGAVVGIDIAKRKFDVALFLKGKFKHKACMNNKQGFEDLSRWLKKQGVEHVRVWKLPALMGMNWPHTCMMLVIWSVLSIRCGSKGLLRVSCFGPRMTRLMPV